MIHLLWPSIRTGSLMPIFKKKLSKDMLIMFFMGFASGLPYLLTGATLSLWLKEEGLSLSSIGLFTLVGVPYTFKFLWAPIFDRYTLPFLGRRKGWLVVVQGFLILSLLGIAMTDPKENIILLAVMCVVTSFVSATQDVLLDAYRREVLPNEELGLGTSVFVTGYRVSMSFIAASLAPVLADALGSWSLVYQIMAGLAGIGLLTTLFSPEPVVKEKPPQKLKEAIVEPLKEFFKRKDFQFILLFILLYKIGDSIAATMLNPFYLDVGFTKTEIGIVAKQVGFWSAIGGGIVGGTLMIKMGLVRALVIFGILQNVITMSFAYLLYTGPMLTPLAIAVGADTFAGAMGTTAFVALMAQLTNKKYSATQYALLSSLMAVPSKLISANAGFLAEGLGWFGFFAFCTIIGLPGLFLLLRFKHWKLY